MISVEEALNALFELTSPLPQEVVSLRRAAGRVMVASPSAVRAQPPFAASSMDGYAIRAEDAQTGLRLDVIGESAAGGAFAGTVSKGQAVRIFTGAPIPDGANHVEIQENVTRSGDQITLTEASPSGANIRKRGQDFEEGHTLSTPRRLTPSDVALLAAMNAPEVLVTRRPTVSLIANGDELVMPGESPADDQIISSNGFGLAALLESVGAIPRILPIARDTADSLSSALRFARGADLIVTIGGASVGDHDIVRDVVGNAGLEQSFYKVAMRPGKPLMAGKVGDTPVIGLPGNPVSAMVCGEIFLKPVVAAMQGLPAAPRARQRAPLAHDLPQNGPRAHYMRARLEDGRLTVAQRQDSGLLNVLAGANALAIVEPRNGPFKAGDPVEFIQLAQS
ncbi:MAG: molybdopterin molybdotransferase MoeA [Rhodobacteraceae bacterium]|nr:molybdopterin molybdotransferase MoeA [Paracoccaceae bacterium]